MQTGWTSKSETTLRWQNVTYKTELGWLRMEATSTPCSSVPALLFDFCDKPRKNVRELIDYSLPLSHVNAAATRNQ